jgi:hypothetical protein
MKILQVLILIFGLSIIVNGQKQNETAILTGSVFSQIGEVISDAKITITNEKGKRFETLTDENGNYKIELPVTVYKGDFDIRKLPITKYTIRIEYRGFRAFEIREFNFIQSKLRNMQLDVALEAGIVE